MEGWWRHHTKTTSWQRIQSQSRTETYEGCDGVIGINVERRQWSLWIHQQQIILRRVIISRPIWAPVCKLVCILASRPILNFQWKCHINCRQTTLRQWSPRRDPIVQRAATQKDRELPQRFRESNLRPEMQRRSRPQWAPWFGKLLSPFKQWNNARKFATMKYIFQLRILTRYLISNC